MDELTGNGKDAVERQEIEAQLLTVREEKSSDAPAPMQKDDNQYSFHVGQHVKAIYNNKWYDAEILHVKEDGGVRQFTVVERNKSRKSSWMVLSDDLKRLPHSPTIDNNAAVGDRLHSQPPSHEKHAGVFVTEESAGKQFPDCRVPHPKKHATPPSVNENSFMGLVARLEETMEEIIQTYSNTSEHEELDGRGRPIDVSSLNSLMDRIDTCTDSTSFADRLTMIGEEGKDNCVGTPVSIPALTIMGKNKVKALDLIPLDTSKQLLAILGEEIVSGCDMLGVLESQAHEENSSDEVKFAKMDTPP